MQQEEILMKLLEGQNQMQLSLVKLWECQNQMQQDITGMKQDITGLKQDITRLENKIDKMEEEIIQEFKATVETIATYVDKKIDAQRNEVLA